jgi:hypothetical protein
MQAFDGLKRNATAAKKVLEKFVPAAARFLGHYGERENNHTSPLLPKQGDALGTDNMFLLDLLSSRNEVWFVEAGNGDLRIRANILERTFVIMGPTSL